MCSEIAPLINDRGIRPGGCVLPGKSNIRFDALRVSYIVHSATDFDPAAIDCGNEAC